MLKRNETFLFLFLVPTLRFLILTNVFRNGSVFAGSTACNIAAGLIDFNEYITVPLLPKMTQHSSTANGNEFLGDVTILVPMEHLQNKNSP